MSLSTNCLIEMAGALEQFSEAVHQYGKVMETAFRSIDDILSKEGLLIQCEIQEIVTNISIINGQAENAEMMAESLREDYEAISSVLAVI